MSHTPGFKKRDPEFQSLQGARVKTKTKGVSKFMRGPKDTLPRRT